MPTITSSQLTHFKLYSFRFKFRREMFLESVNSAAVNTIGRQQIPITITPGGKTEWNSTVSYNSIINCYLTSLIHLLILDGFNSFCTATHCGFYDLITRIVMLLLRICPHLVHRLTHHSFSQTNYPQCHSSENSSYYSSCSSANRIYSVLNVHDYQSYVQMQWYDTIYSNRAILAILLQKVFSDDFNGDFCS